MPMLGVHHVWLGLLYLRALATGYIYNYMITIALYNYTVARATIDSSPSHGDG